MAASYPDPKKVSGHLDAEQCDPLLWPLYICLFLGTGHRTDAPVNTVCLLFAIVPRIHEKQLTALPSGSDVALYVSYNTERLVLLVPGILGAGMVLSASTALASPE